MRILSVLTYSPVPPRFGGALRINGLLRHMARYHDLAIVMYGPPESADGVRSAFGERVRSLTVINPTAMVLGRQKRLSQLVSLARRSSAMSLTYFSGEMQQAIDALARKGESFDLIQVESFPLGQFRYHWPDALKVVDAHNIEFDCIRRMSEVTVSPVRGLFYRREYAKVYREELEVYRQQDAILVTSQRDKDLLADLVPGVPAFVIPNGVDMDYFKPANHGGEGPSLVFTGFMGYPPNTDGMVYFLSTVLPLVRKTLPDVKVYVVGSNPPRELQRLASESVIVTGFVEDVRPYVWNSTVYVVPLRMGGGTRLKVMEALAMKKPVVTTSIGCEGIDVRDGESVLIADTPEAIAAAILRLVSDRKLRERLAETGWRLMKSKYEWSVVGMNLETAYTSIRSVRDRLGTR